MVTERERERERERGLLLRGALILATFAFAAVLGGCTGGGQGNSVRENPVMGQIPVNKPAGDLPGGGWGEEDGEDPPLGGEAMLGGG